MQSGIPEVRVPAATYRLQFNAQFGFNAAGSIAEYLRDLGISDVYASPYFKARSGSLHGYDIIDHNSINPEIGTDADFEQYLEALRNHGLSQVLDIVPNHMCVESSDNAWWQDVLENGRSSLHADYFDINWAPVKRELTDKVLLPVLGAQFGTILENKELWLVYKEGAFVVCYYDHHLPLSPTSYPAILSHGIEELGETLGAEKRELLDELHSIITEFSHIPSDNGTDPALVAERYREKEVAKRRLLRLYNESAEIRGFLDRNLELFNGTPGDPSSFSLLERLLLQQSFRVAHWRVATEEINYRRFFDINALGALRIENVHVFDDVHRLVLELVGRGCVSGLRVDHADGLYNPVKYFHQLQFACYQKLFLMDRHDRDTEQAQKEAMERYQQRLDHDQQFKPFYLLGEKIVLKNETVPADWAIHGETGYSFINAVNHLFVYPGSKETFDSFYRDFTGIHEPFEKVLYNKKKLVMFSSMSSEVNTLGYRLSAIAENNRHTRDFTLNSLTKALVEVIAHFPVYRTYTNSLQTSDADRIQIVSAVGRARRRSQEVDPSVFDFIRDVLTLNFFHDMENEHKFQWLDFVMRFQQITGPVMAKGMEDTSFYVYNRLLSLNEVGGDPEAFGLSVGEFHRQNEARAATVPDAMLASSTHDTKRSEDVRARINILTEIPDEWIGAVLRWSRTNRRHKKLVDGDMVPNPNKEYHIYQTLVGAWPSETDTDSFAQFVERMQAYMRKALREAKERTSWINPDEGYEQGVADFIAAILSDRTFVDDMRLFLRPVALSAMYSSLSMALLKMTCPGVPDFYQGSELWDLRLVDPDNRQPVDFEARAKLLKQVKAMEGESIGAAAGWLAENPDDGRVKLFLIRRVLNFRRDHHPLFRHGDYNPLKTSGLHQEAACAFSRSFQGETAVVIVPRFYARLSGNGRWRPWGQAWGNTRMAVPIAGRYRNVLTDETHELPEGEIALSAALRIFPVALLVKE